MDPAIPTPDHAAEEAFLASWRSSDDLDGLVACVGAALEAGRPQLAGRLVGLLDGRIEIEPGSALDRARRVAGMLVLARPEAVPGLVDDLERAWADARSDHLRRVRARVRARQQQGSGLFLDQGGPPHREPRLRGRKHRG
jgi:hypothetical protein